MIWERIIKRRRPACEHRYRDDWIITTEVKVNGRWLRPGTEFKVKGERGRMRFVRHVEYIGGNVSWVDCFDKNKQFRSFRKDRITRIHSKNQTRENHREDDKK